MRAGWRAAGRGVRVLVALELAALLVLGGVAVARFHVFAEIDERAHYAYVQEVAEEARLPVLGRDTISWQAQAIDDGSWPRRSARDPARMGFAGQSYEAFQPPLYYVAAAPWFAVGGDHRDKVFVVRAFDLLLLLLAVALLARLARAVFGPERWLLPFALALGVVLWPGVLVRGITLSNQALELPLALAFLNAVWEARARRSAAALVIAGGLLGLLLLTRLTMVYLAPLLLAALVPVARERGARAAAAGALALPALLLAPWLASNLARYDALTANTLARDMQEPVLNPARQPYDLASVPDRAVRLADAVLPQEWWPEYGRALLGTGLRTLAIALVLLAAYGAIRRPAVLRSGAAAVLALPVVLGVAMMALVYALSDWDLFFPRYLNPALPALALFGAWAWRERGGEERVLTGAAWGAAALVAVAWVVMAGAYFFTDAGASLGIRPAR